MGCLAILAVLGQVADLAVTGARVYTMDRSRPRATAIAVKDGRILAVGDSVAAHLGPRTKHVDAKGATVVPGFIDSHVHLRSLGESLEILDFRAAHSEDEIAGQVRRVAADRKPGLWI
ncbi:MAG: amidohydrolase family protein, partial [Bryobacteraceae bacterium]